MTASPRTGPPDPSTGLEPDAARRAEALLWVDGGRLHPRLEAVLRRAQAGERTAVGEYRRPAFRLTREILGASVRAGVPVQLLADCLGRSRASVLNRSSGLDGTLTPELLKRLTDLTPVELDRLSGGELTRHSGQVVPALYSTTDVVRALLKTPRP